MSDDKITISMDDVNRATPVPGTTLPPVYTSGYVPPESDSVVKPKRTGLFVGIGIAVVALLCITGIGIMAINRGPGGEPRPPRTVSDYKAEVIRDINKEVSSPDSKLRKRIEDAHITVDVTSAEVIRCDVATIDGTEKAGKNDSNIGQVSALIRFNWKGKLDSGHTDLRLVLDVKNNQLLKSEIEETTALINIEDPELWRAVGNLIGELIGEAFL